MIIDPNLQSNIILHHYKTMCPKCKYIHDNYVMHDDVVAAEVHCKPCGYKGLADMHYVGRIVKPVYSGPGGLQNVSNINKMNE